MKTLRVTSQPLLLLARSLDILEPTKWLRASNASLKKPHQLLRYKMTKSKKRKEPLKLIQKRNLRRMQLLLHLPVCSLVVVAETSLTLSLKEASSKKKTSTTST